MGKGKPHMYHTTCPTVTAIGSTRASETIGMGNNLNDPLDGTVTQTTARRLAIKDSKGNQLQLHLRECGLL